MSETYNTKAIVLRSVPWREADRLYTLYTERAGKQLVHAPGANKLQSKLAGALQPFAEIEAFIIQGRTWPKIGGTEVVKRFKNLQPNSIDHLSAIHSAWFCCELVERLTQPNQPDAALYQLLYSILIWLDVEAPHRTVLYSFVIKMIHILGYQAEETITGDNHKIITWLQQASFAEAQRLRLTNEQWQAVWRILHIWLYEQGIEHIHSEPFLV